MCQCFCMLQGFWIRQCFCTFLSVPVEVTENPPRV
jgi:hypothetical protein